MRLPSALMALAVLLAQALPAQKTQKTAPTPTRPHLDAGADTNDARTYYRYGMQMVNSKPAEADVINQYPAVDRAELNVHVLEQMSEMRKKGWMFYAEGRFPDALDAYAKQLHDKRRNKKDHEENDSEVHAERARIFYQMGNMDSARAELTTAIAGMRERDTKRTVILYESKAIYEQSLGMIDERSSKPDDAREAYGQALTEDLSYYAAHSLLSQLQLRQGDTTAALSEMDLAVQLQPNDPALRYSYAVLLVQSRRDADAVTQLMKSIALDPYYAAPRLLLARISDVEEYTEEAVKGYQDYVSLSPKSDPQLAMVRTRLAALTSAVASTSAKP